ncbi:uncharacterized protein AB675_9000 [Cyphellophora attinorum]|uniref:Uncharacterized protein n=1 Tax=Cyphellophora attinorum TaxID=1664694 RepID=A0A0N1NZS7_9EURO|nr:uncharacterized protein AB675_9000 [Phialophora attinorum]KPI41483.1 hypothetical protein AB675_9000 [Phialophora attinorum]
MSPPPRQNISSAAMSPRTSCEVVHQPQPPTVLQGIPAVSYETIPPLQTPMSSAKGVLDNVSEFNLKDEEKAVTSDEALKGKTARDTRQKRRWHWIFGPIMQALYSLAAGLVLDYVLDRAIPDRKIWAPIVFSIGTFCVCFAFGFIVKIAMEHCPNACNQCQTGNATASAISNATSSAMSHATSTALSNATSNALSNATSTALSNATSFDMSNVTSSAP